MAEKGDCISGSSYREKPAQGLLRKWKLLGLLAASRMMVLHHLHVNSNMENMLIMNADFRTPSPEITIFARLE